MSGELMDREQEAMPEGLKSEVAADQVVQAIAAYIRPEGEIASLDDMRVTRDGAGRVEPMRRLTLWENHVVTFRPLTYRDRNKYRLDDRGLLQLEDEERLEFLQEHMVKPSFEDVASLEDFGWTTVDDLLLTIQLFSRDRKRKELPRPMGEEESGGKAGA